MRGLSAASCSIQNFGGGLVLIFISSSTPHPRLFYSPILRIPSLVVSFARLTFPFLLSSSVLSLFSNDDRESTFYTRALVLRGSFSAFGLARSLIQIVEKPLSDNTGIPSGLCAFEPRQSLSFRVHGQLMHWLSAFISLRKYPFIRRYI